ncbi:MAG: transposase family protein [Gammaproteobacteria bacterium]|nr:transposase family protein [Gammaproteobacteria bacterium]
MRVDTVHQGDQDKKKGVYHINLVDEVTQCEVCFSVEKISEAFLIGPLEAALAQFPFEIKGFHTDNGSEYINQQVARLLQKLKIEFTKSRSRQTNDNALVESKNATILRKYFGYSHIEQGWAKALNAQLQEPMYRFINFHRPCFFSDHNHQCKRKSR